MFYGLIKFEVILRHANDTDLYQNEVLISIFIYILFICSTFLTKIAAYNDLLKLEKFS